MKEGGCSMCDKNGMCGQHHWMHIIIKILIALFIFWCGVQFGELKSMLRAAYYNGGYGYGMMNSYGVNRSQGYYGVPVGMMGGWTYGTATVPTTTTTTTKTPAKK